MSNDLPSYGEIKQQIEDFDKTEKPIFEQSTSELKDLLIQNVKLIDGLLNTYDLSKKELIRLLKFTSRNPLKVHNIKLTGPEIIFSSVEGHSVAEALIQQGQTAYVFNIKAFLEKSQELQKEQENAKIEEKGVSNE